jgi:hypothetical protein
MSVSASVLKVFPLQNYIGFSRSFAFCKCTQTKFAEVLIGIAIGNLWVILGTLYKHVEIFHLPIYKYDITLHYFKVFKFIIKVFQFCSVFTLNALL